MRMFEREVSEFVTHGDLPNSFGTRLDTYDAPAPRMPAVNDLALFDPVGVLFQPPRMIDRPEKPRI